MKRLVTLLFVAALLSLAVVSLSQAAKPEAPAAEGGSIPEEVLASLPNAKEASPCYMAGSKTVAAPDLDAVDAAVSSGRVAAGATTAQGVSVGSFADVAAARRAQVIVDRDGAHWIKDPTNSARALGFVSFNTPKGNKAWVQVASLEASTECDDTPIYESAPPA